MLRRRKNKYFIITLSIFLLLAGSYRIFMPKPAPDVSFKTLTNKIIQLNELRGKTLLITFWASNCPSCLKEIPHFKSLYQDYHQAGLEIIAIAMYYDRPNYVVDTRNAYQIPYDIVLDLDMQLASAFGNVSLTPTTFLINPEGNIAFKTTGTFDLTEMQDRIQSIFSNSHALLKTEI
ncbi:conserved hypothetical protein [Bathymodiolus platifrons methanotrophic gill symbiont]|uniref:peroxiredoxin family protein n=2 Tax=Bathymodiolus platifrons methanotrophic gill symbiont TaxID=113268 RepID=UPI000B418E10|nr:TlpA disulfide reductase family protein [Bathymodiolus platifrons methanotrophic gill symbiont]TXK99451.1 thioredoxin [Methylococcaceae bacterium CS4]TXL00781.1 thioredoxin [Methylococcaceae bacterium CS5]TXL01650.1 thioredoxin [Methylococcaceae bacterium HT1]TXL08847.1 thioredoxin [Methylococcaceae bacterium CS1]TXL08989.1 thioredoxin [Methylococcaceae bacterium CS3]TXL10997.1 thioredoxin [Methylococcaceae bacterium CS2]TXL12859.1 thioredoxin [Methylococcaceae bacterium HT4]TXL18649.1 t